MIGGILREASRERWPRPLPALPRRATGAPGMARTARSRVIVCPQCGTSRIVKQAGARYAKRCRECSKPGHGLSDTKIWTVWRSMRDRCSIGGTGSQFYYDRGIRVCAEWDDFTAFHRWAMNNGWREGLQIDRINNNGNYEPSNSRFVTAKVNSRNTRRNVNISAFGKTQCMSAWAEEYGIMRATLRFRLNRGWPIEGALLAPVRRRA
jgi:predicted RNA-binding Zn-ribbon protein involved in translation (DUF1610 family)